MSDPLLELAAAAENEAPPAFIDPRAMPPPEPAQPSPMILKPQRPHPLRHLGVAICWGFGLPLGSLLFTLVFWFVIVALLAAVASSGGIGGALSR